MVDLFPFSSLAEVIPECGASRTAFHLQINKKPSNQMEWLLD